MNGDDEVLKTRLVRAVVEALRDGDPVVTVGIDDRELHIQWRDLNG